MYISLLGNPLKVIETRLGYDKKIYLCEDFFGLYDWVIPSKEEENVKGLTDFNEKDTLGFFLFYSNLYTLRDMSFQLTGKETGDIPSAVYSFLLKLGYIDKDKKILVGGEGATYFSAYFFRLKIKNLRRLFIKDLEAKTQILGKI